MGIIVFLGDSITDAGRKDSPNQLGYGYVNIFADSLKESGTDWNIVNRGVDGYITERVARALYSDCISLHPDYVSILVGINDIGMIVRSQVSWQDKLYLLEDSIRSYHEMLFDLSRETEAKVITLEYLPGVGSMAEKNVKEHPQACEKLWCSLYSYPGTSEPENRGIRIQRHYHRRNPSHFAGTPGPGRHYPGLFPDQAVISSNSAFTASPSFFGDTFRVVPIRPPLT